MNKPSREQMVQWRIVEKIGILKIARMLHCRNQYIVDLLREYDLLPHGALVTKAWLLNQYVMQDKSVDQIAEDLQLDESTVRYYLRKYEIPIVYKTRGSIRMPALHNRALLVEMYHGQQMSQASIAKELQCSLSSVCWAFLRLKIPTRFQLQRVGNPDTRQGHHVFTVHQRTLILERDHHCCQMPNCARTSTKLEIHHIVPRYRGGGNGIDNGITLCRRCHWQTFDREEEFEELFLALIREPLA